MQVIDSGMNDVHVHVGITIAKFRYIKIQPETIYITARLWGINIYTLQFIPQSLEVMLSFQVELFFILY